MINAAMVAIIEESGSAVLTLTEGLEEVEFLRSRLTRPEVRRQVQAIAATTANLPAELQSQLPEIDWDGWAATARQLRSGDDDGAILWSVATALIPATLTWLRVYRHNQPNLFSATA